MKKKKIEEKTYNIKLHTQFNLAHENNVKNIAIALASAGFYVNIKNGEDGFFILYAFTLI